MNAASKIDVVIPWVDDQDPVWLAKKTRYMREASMVGDLSADNRYLEYGTLQYVLRSIARYLPWVNRVFLLTDHQVPAWLNTDRVAVVDHTEFITERLPTFNSNVILTSIGHIHALSDQFIIFNDEMIVWQPLPPTAFFKNGLPVDALIETGTVPKDDGFFHISQNGVALANRLFSKRQVMRHHWRQFFNWRYGRQMGRTVLSLPYGGFIGFQNQHLLLPYRKTDFDRAYQLVPEAFRLTWNHRFRSLEDINEWTVRYLRNLAGDFTPGYLNGTFLTLADFKTSPPSLPRRTKVIVINDDGHYADQVVDKVARFLNARFPEKCAYEK